MVSRTRVFSVGSNGFQGFSTDVAGRFSRNSYAGYLDLDVDVTSRWLVSGAVRYEHFSDFGDTTKGKVATRYEVYPSFALRGAVSTGFRAPSVGQSNLRRAATTFVDGRLVESLTLPPTNPVAVQKGGKSLEPEESVNWSLGGAFSLGPVDITLDWFHIKVDGRIALTQQNLSNQDRSDLIAANIVGAETVTAVSFFVNDIDSETSGIDVVVDSGFDWAGGRLNVTLAGNLTDTEITNPGVTLSPATTRELEDSLPNMRATLTTDYTRGAWSGLVRVNYYDSVYEHLFNCESCAITTDPMAVVDAELTWKLTPTYAVSLGVRNLLDRQPDKHQFAGVSGYLGADYPLNHPQRLRWRQLLSALDRRVLNTQLHETGNLIERPSALSSGHAFEGVFTLRTWTASSLHSTPFSLTIPTPSAVHPSDETEKESSSKS